MAIRSAWERSARALRSARTACAQVCRSARLRPAAEKSTERSTFWSGDWPRTASWSTASVARATARTWLSSNPRFPIIGRKRRSSAMPTRWSCRGSRTCDGAATRWSWNRRAPARCSEFAIRRSRPHWPCCPRRNTSNSCAGRRLFRGRAARPAPRLPDSSQGRRWQRKRASTGRGRPQPCSLGLSRSSLPRAQHGRPARQSAGRNLSVRRDHFSTAGRAAQLARKDHRSAQGFGSDSGGDLARRKTPRDRHSTRGFDDRRPITLAELSQFLDGTARVLTRSNTKLDLDDGGHTVRPYPSAGAGLRARALFGRQLMRRACTRLLSLRRRRSRAGADCVPGHELEALLVGAETAMGAPAAPQILITIAARFGRMSWKYSSIAYALILRTSAYSRKRST